VCDDASADETYEVGISYQSEGTLPLTVIKHAANLRYGGNQKYGYAWALDNGYDIVVLLHGDGQYAPEVIQDLIGPLVSGDADVVMGSRMMERGSALRGGMPLYKFVGNRILSTFQNWMTGATLTEWHSGYRAYRVDALADIPFAEYSNDFDFDTEIILGMLEAEKRILEVPIPTYYGDEICYVNGMAYAKDVVQDVVLHRARAMGFGRSPVPDSPTTYPVKHSPHSSHGRLLGWIAASRPGRVLDIGCSDAEFASLARLKGHEVTGVDKVKLDSIADRLDHFVEGDLNDGLPAGVTGAFDLIVAADVLEHTLDPQHLLGQMAGRLAPGGSILVSVPNFGHWYPRARVALGRFDYDQRGPLDQSHLRFFTRRSFEAMVRRADLRIVDRDVVGTPVEPLQRGLGPSPSRIIGRLENMDRAAVRLWPTLFGYQFLYRLEPAG
jgi:SAM-dependent methyltransferase